MPDALGPGAASPTSPAAERGQRSLQRRALLPLSITALGVVYGDIGTSPLYAFRECFFGSHSVPPTHENVLGVLSLIIYSLLIVISIKYLALVMRADNQGEGGILALTSLQPRNNGTRYAPLVLLGLFGAALLYGDGMITPAITVLGAIEGLKVATPLFEPYVVPITVGILMAVFAIQKHGTHRVGGLFGPVMVLWFLSIAATALPWIVREPVVLAAIDPRHAVAFFTTNGLHGLAVLGAVFLVVTGGEALYADMGHFGKRPIRVAWFAFVLPSLLVNYFGQGALLLLNPAAASQPFFRLAPGWALLPLVAIATAAAVIASQALISGAFSLTRQAIQLGYWPRMGIEHTSPREIGQVYVPQVNWALMIATIAIVVGFGSSAALAAAYGIAVTMTMVITVVLLHVVMTHRWRWPSAAAGAATAVFLAVDGAFFGANVLKIAHGGWLPLVIAAVLFTLMTTWKSGREALARRLKARALPFQDFLAAIRPMSLARVSGTAVFMTAHPGGTPPALVHNVQHNKVLHQIVIVLMVKTRPLPYVPRDERVEVAPLGNGIFSVTVYYGFMQDPDVPDALLLANEHGLDADLSDVTYFLGRETILIAPRPTIAMWRQRLFAQMSKNSVTAVGFFRLPPDRVVELGVQVEM
jgi:KUP system potassium uptake protein